MAIKDVRFWSLMEFNQFYSVIDDDYWRLLFLVLYYYEDLCEGILIRILKKRTVATNIQYGSVSLTLGEDMYL